MLLLNHTVTPPTVVLQVFITRFESTGEIGVIAVNWDVQTELTIRPDVPELQALKGASPRESLRLKRGLRRRGAMVGVVGINQHVFTARMGTGKYKGDPHVQSDNKLFMTEVTRSLLDRHAFN